MRRDEEYLEYILREKAETWVMHKREEKNTSEVHEFWGNVRKYMKARSVTNPGVSFLLLHPWFWKVTCCIDQVDCGLKVK